MTRFLLLLTAVCFYNLAIGQDEGASFYEIEQVAEIKVYFDTDDWPATLDSLKKNGNDHRLPGKVVVNGRQFEGVGVRYKGNSSFHNVRKAGASKLPFNIKLDYGEQEHQLAGGFETIKLSNVFRDPSFLREVLSYEIAGKYMPAPRANYARLYVNDRYLGFYNSTESVDKKFLETHFGNSSGTLIKCDPNWEHPQLTHCTQGDRASLEYLGEDSLCYMGLYEMKSDYGWSDLIELTRTLEKEPEQIEKILDVDQVLWMLAFNNVLVNLDSYTGMLCHNYYLYRDTFGVFHPILWDMNLSLGGFRYIDEKGGLTDREMQELSPFVHYRNDRRPLIKHLLSNSLYRKIYLAHIRTILEENFADGSYLERAKKVQDSITPYVESDSNKLYVFEEFRRNIDSTSHVDNQEIIGIAELMEERTAYLAAHPLLQKQPPVISEVRHDEKGGNISITATVEGAEQLWLFYRYDDTGTFRRIAMEGGDGDATATAPTLKSWTATIAPGAGARYYVVAEGDKTAALFPQQGSVKARYVEQQ